MSVDERARHAAQFVEKTVVVTADWSGSASLRESFTGFVVALAHGWGGSNLGYILVLLCEGSGNDRVMAFPLRIVRKIELREG
ncbi:hypothetical protein I0C86_41145 [Plantactinospora sp. S1510]|uniref:Uncharacterized protein n=1 Tax=Plantactinospora alkalitolerans TaxID=2789879 RepID=A0ABS0H9V2_9ACTN|nr:hypothetical protein [Plantactinospora alkalitolerans]MBF9135259.1 hypothetical protein [Plantactinospora alkalitolerans]